MNNNAIVAFSLGLTVTFMALCVYFSVDANEQQLRFGELDTQHTELTKEHRLLQADLELLKSTNDKEIEQMEARLSGLVEDTQDREAQLARLHAELRTAQDIVDEQDSRLAEEQSRGAFSGEQVDDLRLQLSTLEELNRDLNRQSVQLAQSLDDMQGQFEDQTCELLAAKEAEASSKEALFVAAAGQKEADRQLVTTAQNLIEVEMQLSSAQKTIAD